MSQDEVQQLSPTVLRKFWARVDKSSGYGPAGNCWKWTGHFGGSYPRFCLRGKMIPAGRVALWIAQGHEPKGQIGHRCGTTGCVNPTHLVEGATGLYALGGKIGKQALPFPTLDLPALMRPADVAAYTVRHPDALTAVATSSLLTELGRRFTDPGLAAGVAEELGAFLNSNSAGEADSSPDGGNDLLLRLRCDANLCGQGSEEPFLVYEGSIHLKWFDDDDDEGLLHYSTLGHVRFTIIKDAAHLHTCMAELEAGVVLDAYLQLLRHPVDADGVDWAQCVRDTEAVNDMPMSLLIVEEMTLEDPVASIPLHAWVVDALIEHFDFFGRVMVAWCGGPADGDDQDIDSQRRIQQATHWASAGLVHVEGTDFVIGDMDHRNTQMPRLPSIEAMLNDGQKRALEVSDVMP